MTKHTAEEVREHSILKWSNKQTDVYLNAYAELLAEKENNGTTHWNGTTHYAGCIQSGKEHYECALQEIGRLRGTVTHLRAELEKKTWLSAYEKKPWVGLTDEEINSIEFPESGTATMKDFVRIIESKLKDKNGG